MPFPYRLLSVIGFLLLSGQAASAISAEVAKKCNALTDKQFPPREVGNPAAGSAAGTGRDQRLFFNKCVANGGKVQQEDAK